MIHHYLGCGKCKYCLSGWTQLCVQGRTTQGTDVHGGHADFMVCPDTCCIPLLSELTFEEGAMLSCGTGTAFHALKRLDVSGRDTLAIFGQGPVGMSATMLAKTMGARVIAIDTVQERLESSKRFGAYETIDASEVDTVAAIKQLTKGEGADATMDCSGNEQARVNALRSTRIWGRACFVGERGTATFDISELFLRKQLTVYGSWTFSTHGLSEIANYVVQHKVPIKDLITHRFSIDQAKEAYRLFADGKTNKAVFVWS
jgi:threonine dehydrogenase-like Zn-dependent dehydrogenase